MALDYNPALPRYYHRVKTVTEKVYTYEGTEPQISEGEYAEMCCHAPIKTGCVPYCREIKSTYYGPVDIEGGRQKYIDQYAGKTVFVPVGTEDGPCGILTTTFIDPDLTCCPALAIITIVAHYNSDDIIRVYNGNRKIIEIDTSSISPDSPEEITKAFDPRDILYLEYKDLSGPAGETVEWYVYYDDELGPSQPPKTYRSTGGVYYSKSIDPVC